MVFVCVCACVGLNQELLHFFSQNRLDKLPELLKKREHTLLNNKQPKKRKKKLREEGVPRIVRHDHVDVLGDDEHDRVHRFFERPVIARDRRQVPQPLAGPRDEADVPERHHQLTVCVRVCVRETVLF